MRGAVFGGRCRRHRLFVAIRARNWPASEKSNAPTAHAEQTFDFSEVALENLVFYKHSTSPKSDRDAKIRDYACLFLQNSTRSVATWPLDFFKSPNQPTYPIAQWPYLATLFFKQKNMSALPYVESKIAPNGTATVEFFHPNHNSLPSDLLRRLAEAFDTLGADPTVRVIVLRSATHNTFCAGASFDELSAIADFDTGKQFFSGFGRVINAMRRCPKIIVGRIHGKAVGGGVGLAAATDYCMASQFASVRLSELAVGFGPFVIGPAVERKMGVAAFSKLALTPTEWQNAAWAREQGLFQECFDTVERLDGYVSHFTAQLCASAPEALAELKQIFWAGTAHWDTLLDERAAISGRLALSDFTREAIAAFKAK
jgi:methylglutaconyl-CoA hydratase